MSAKWFKCIFKPVSLGLVRSDLMLETSCARVKECKRSPFYCCWKQVEVNTIASGFGWLGPISAAIQRFKWTISTYVGPIKMLGKYYVVTINNQR